MWFLICAGVTFLLILAAGLLWFLNYMLVKVPQQQILLCDTFSPMAVRYAEQKHPLFDEEQKYFVAVERLKEIYEEYQLLPLGDTAIDTAIRSAIYTVWKEQELLGLSKLKAELDQKAESLEITQSRKAIKKRYDTDSIDRIFGVI
jgi:hypothetical protein